MGLGDWSWIHAMSQVEFCKVVHYPKPLSHMWEIPICQVGIECAGECDQEKLNNWIAKLLRERGTDIFRTKGVLAVTPLEIRGVMQLRHGWCILHWIKIWCVCLASFNFCSQGMKWMDTMDVSVYVYNYIY